MIIFYFIGTLKTFFKQQESELKTAKESLNAALEYNNQLKTELQANKKGVKELEVKNDVYTRKNSLEIEGIPENICDNEEAVLKLSRTGLERQRETGRYRHLSQT